MPIPIEQQLAELLHRRQIKLVLAESCTGGLAAAMLTRVPGISEWFCGSAVTYRKRTKAGWLGVTSETLAQFTAESQQATTAMAIGVLKKTPEADWSAAITGTLGNSLSASDDSKSPTADTNDGVVFITLARRATASEKETATKIDLVAEQSFQLASILRVDRQAEASELLLRQLTMQLQRV